jgi:hypothetical protein
MPVEPDAGLAFSRSHAPDAEKGESSSMGLDADDIDLFHSKRAKSELGQSRSSRGSPVTPGVLQ